MSDTDRVELALEMIARFEDETVSVADVIDRIETVTTDPRRTREILETAQERGLIERSGETVRPSATNYLSFEREVITKEGDFSCARCGTSLSTGHFMNLESGEIGPFGSTCIRIVTGRE